MLKAVNSVINIMIIMITRYIIIIESYVNDMRLLLLLLFLFGKLFFCCKFFNIRTLSSSLRRIIKGIKWNTKYCIA